jgi:hypothetical protein
VFILPACIPSEGSTIRSALNHSNISVQPKGCVPPPRNLVSKCTKGSGARSSRGEKKISNR